MDENHTPRPEDSEQTGNTELDNLEQAFQQEREKKVENFVLDLDEEAIASDVETESVPEEGERDLSSFSEESSRKVRKERAMSRRKKHGCMYRALYLCAVLAVATVLGQFIVAGMYDLLGASRQAGEVEIIIDPDMTDDDVVDALVHAGAVTQPFFFKLYAKVTKAFYGPGTYVIQRDADYELINNSLKGVANRIDTVKVTFYEGETIADFAKHLESANVCSAESFLKAVNEEDFTNYTFIADIADPTKRAYLLEGYLFPDTYEFYQYEQPKTAIKRFLNNMNSTKLTKEMLDRAKELNMSTDQVLTLASMVQKEAADKEDMYKISSVFHNRLNNWGAEAKLQSDPTYEYEQEVGDQYKGMYDTYVCNGLPVGPICNPGMDAILAALYPSNTKYYYFVADVNGKTYYANTLAEHERNVAYASKVQPASSAAAGD